MRLAKWLRLFALVVLTTGLVAPCSSAAGRLTQTGPKKPVLTEEFTGYGKTVKDAEEHVLDQALDSLAKRSDLGWVPSKDYLRNKDLVRFDKPSEEEFEKAGRMQVVKGHLEINADQAHDIQRHARQERMTARHWLLVKVLVGLVCLLAVVGGYLRLEEATRGYSTRLLRLAAVCILAVVGVGLLLIG